MSTHFSSFTPEAMRAFGEDLAAGLQRRADFLENTRENTLTMLAGFRRDRQEAAKNRRQCAEAEADARRLSMSELKSGVHALLGRFELSRKAMAGDLGEMASELRAACDAFRNRSGHQDDFFFRRSQQPKQEQSNPSASPFHAAVEGQDAGETRSSGGGKPGHSKKRHG